MIRFHDSNAMVGELMVGSGKVEFRHVTGSTAVSGNLAGSGPGLGAAMAGPALGIVIARMAVHLVVRVMAGQATNARIIGVVAGASHEAIGLETNIRNVEPA